jgi:hypothetical protein
VLSQNQPDAIDAEVTEVSAAPAIQEEDHQKRDLKFIAASRNLPLKKRLAALVEAYLTDNVTGGTFHFELVDMFPFSDSDRYKFESRIREQYSQRHPTLNDFDEATAVEESQMRIANELKDRVI